MLKRKKRLIIAYGLMLSSIVVAAEATILTLHFVNKNKKANLANDEQNTNNNKIEIKTNKN